MLASRVAVFLPPVKILDNRLEIDSKLANEPKSMKRIYAKSLGVYLNGEDCKE
jgi:hypothetical protein